MTYSSYGWEVESNGDRSDDYVGYCHQLNSAKNGHIILKIFYEKYSKKLDRKAAVYE